MNDSINYLNDLMKAQSKTETVDIMSKYPGLDSRYKTNQKNRINQFKNAIGSYVDTKRIIFSKTRELSTILNQIKKKDVLNLSTHTISRICDSSAIHCSLLIEKFSEIIDKTTDIEREFGKLRAPYSINESDGSANEFINLISDRIALTIALGIESIFDYAQFLHTELSSEILEISEKLGLTINKPKTLISRSRTDLAIAIVATSLLNARSYEGDAEVKVLTRYLAPDVTKDNLLHQLEKITSTCIFRAIDK